MNVRTMLTKLVSLVTFNMHKTRQQAVLACVHSLANGSAGTVTSIGRGIRSKAYEKHRIKRADRLLSNQALRQDIPALYTAISHVFCHAKHPVIAIDWSDLDDHKGHFLLRAAMTLKGRSVTLYQEVHSNSTKEKPATHKRFLTKLSSVLPSQCQPIIVTDAGFKSPWFRLVQAMQWHFVGRVRKPHFYSVDQGSRWQCITHLYQQATARAKRFERAKIARNRPFDCTLVLIKQPSKGRHATNPDGSHKQSGQSIKHAQSANDPWLLATSLPLHRKLAKQVVGIYRQRMQIEEGFRDMKSRRFGLGVEQSHSIKPDRLTVLMLLTTLASLMMLLLGMVIWKSGKHRRFQANTSTNPTLSWHSLGLRGMATAFTFTHSQWQRAMDWFYTCIDEAWLGEGKI